MWQKFQLSLKKSLSSGGFVMLGECICVSWQHQCSKTSGSAVFVYGQHDSVMDGGLFLKPPALISLLPQGL